MQIRNIVALILVLVSFVLLIPGLTRDLITIRASFTLFGQTNEIFAQTRSILGTVESLHDSGNDFVAGLILLFSVVVPFVKGALLGWVVLLKNTLLRFRVFAFVRTISKWAMADVFVVGVYVAYLSAEATDNLEASIHQGFYFFAAYCLVSLLAMQFMVVEKPPAGAWVKGQKPS
jgi:uncharacterized paraquat-inducible protein A